jgi:nicotinamidase-related amidase
MTNPMSSNPTALLLIDIQQAMDDPYWGPRNNPDAESNASRVLTAFREAALPVVHVQHRSVRPQSPLYPGKPNLDIKPEVAPLEGEPVWTKSVNSAFIGTGLQAYLRAQGIKRLVIAGLTTNQCVETSTRMAANLGFSPILVHDACAANDLTGPDGRVWEAETVHQMTVANIHAEFGQVMTAQEIVASIAPSRTATPPGD